MIKEQYDLNTPLKETIEKYIPRRKKISRWYNPPPKWYLLKNNPKDPILNKKKKQEWNRLMESILRAHRNS